MKERLERDLFYENGTWICIDAYQGQHDVIGFGDTEAEAIEDAEFKAYLRADNE